MHGYEVITELEAQSGGRWRPSAGSVYPTLQQLSDEGLVTSEEIDGRRVYALTDEGKAAAAAAPRSPWADAGRGRGNDVRQLARQVAEAAMQVQRVGTPEAAIGAREILIDTRAKLYGLLASDARIGRLRAGRRRRRRRRPTRPDARLIPRSAMDVATRSPPLRRAGPRPARATSSRARNSRIASVARSTRSFGSGLSPSASSGREDQREQHAAQQLRRGLGRQLRIGRAGLREATDDGLLELVHRLVQLLVVRVVEVLVRMEVRRVDVRLQPLEARRPPAAGAAPRASRHSCAASSIASWIDAIRCSATVVYRSALSVKW